MYVNVLDAKFTIIHKQSYRKYRTHITKRIFVLGMDEWSFEFTSRYYIAPLTKPKDDDNTS